MSDSINIVEGLVIDAFDVRVKRCFAYLLVEQVDFDIATKNEICKNLWDLYD
jgi:NADH:ubiquinone oxidoreductase subunit F (NADH-binding)